jgi:hypothetical protein
MIALLLSELTLSPAVSLSPEARSFLSVLIRSEPAHGRAQPTGFRPVDPEGAEGFFDVARSRLK